MKKKSPGRPKGSKSTRNILSMKKIKEIIKIYSLYTDKEIMKKYKCSKTQLRNIKKEYNLKSKNIAQYIKKYKGDIPKSSGLYSIVKSDGTKVYIGSSVNRRKRIHQHLIALRNNCHYNQELQEDFNKYGVYISIYSDFPEHSLLEEENKILRSLDSSVIYNKVISDKIQCIKFLSNIFKKVKYDIKDNCWKPKRKINSSGYCIIIYNSKEYLIHRLSYIYHNKKIPDIIHHICNNKWCCNPSHLKNVSCKQNTNYYYETIDTLKTSKLYPYLNEIQKLRNDGISYKKIANLLPIKVNPSTIHDFVGRVGFINN